MTKKTILTEVGTMELTELLASGYDIEVTAYGRPYVLKDGKPIFSYCGDCGDVVHYDDFGKHKTKLHGFYSLCHACNAEINRKRRSNEDFRRKESEQQAAYRETADYIVIKSNKDARHRIHGRFGVQIEPFGTAPAHQVTAIQRVLDGYAICPFTNEPIDRNTFETDHIIGVSKYGSKAFTLADGITFTLPISIQANRRKRNLSVIEFIHDTISIYGHTGTTEQRFNRVVDAIQTANPHFTRDEIVFILELDYIESTESVPEAIAQ